MIQMSFIKKSRFTNKSPRAMTQIPLYGTACTRLCCTYELLNKQVKQEHAHAHAQEQYVHTMNIAKKRTYIFNIYNMHETECKQCTRFQIHRNFLWQKIDDPFLIKLCLLTTSRKSRRRQQQHPHMDNHTGTVFDYVFQQYQNISPTRAQACRKGILYF